MSDIIERAKAVLQHRDTLIGHGLVRELVAELQASRGLLAATQSTLSDTIADFCTLRDALPRKQVEQLLANSPTGHNERQPQ